MPQSISRRKVLALFGTTAGMALLPRTVRSIPVAEPQANPSLIYCLNTATIRGHNLGMVKELEIAAKAGFHSVEIWMDTLQTYIDAGGTTRDLKKRLNGLGMQVDNCIGFAEWIVDDDARRKKGMEQMKREMDILAQIGCRRIAAPPMGATETPGLDLRKAAERYRAILELGDTTGVVPHLELWGFSKNLSRASEVLYVAMESGHPSAKVLLDVFHLYKGGSPLNTLSMINPASTAILHMNDYPSNLSPDAITDADRTYPGDGVAPVKQILNVLHRKGQPLILSVEVFNKNYYKQDALMVAKTALAKLKSITSGIA
jgi:sugar phosphate isomerase/epimerase